jgi:predicted MFS family arabinose efflux permease
VDIGFHPGTAGLLAALGSVVGLITRIGTGAMADRRTFHQFRVVVVMLTVGAVGYLGLATGARWLFIPATVIAYGAGWGWNGLFNYTVVRTHPGAVAQATGLTQAGVYVGGTVGPLGIGILLGHVSFSVVWTVVAAAALTAAITILVGRRMMMRWLGNRSDRSDLSVFT